ncbi:hypothetical protein ABEB36_009437 [Hypothenemus hampei]|uniref:PiggyBac transposable element-derived protein domain-containing protein n=1 Tax=Hypothenemus hampei TaxID=57062 RepID=A0ABD1EGB8_HYPHA
MSKKWNLNNPRHAAEALEFFYSLPENENDSEDEADEGAMEEYQDLELLCTPGCNSSCSSTSLNQSTSADGVFFLPTRVNIESASTNSEEEEDPADYNNNNNNEEWSQNSDYFDNLNLSFDKSPNSAREFCNQAKELDFFFEIFDGEILCKLVDQTNLYARQ